MDHLDEFNTLLESIGAKIEEDSKAILLLVSLPLPYEHLRTTLIHMKDMIAFDVVVATLILHEAMRKRDSETAIDEGAMVASDDGNSRGRAAERWHGPSDWDV